MNVKIILLLLLAVSFLLSGCAKKAEPANVTPPEETPEEEEPEAPPAEIEEEAPPAEEPEDEAPEEPEYAVDRPDVDDKDLADLFAVDTDKPLEDEGFDVETPSSADE